MMHQLLFEHAAVPPDGDATIRQFMDDAAFGEHCGGTNGLAHGRTLELGDLGGMARGARFLAEAPDRPGDEHGNGNRQAAPAAL
jgi:hypothetical protein